MILTNTKKREKAVKNVAYLILLEVTKASISYSENSQLKELHIYPAFLCKLPNCLVD